MNAIWNVGEDSNVVKGVLDRGWSVVAPYIEAKKDGAGTKLRIGWEIVCFVHPVWVGNRTALEPIKVL